MPEKFILAACLFCGFLWLRNRSRSLDLESRKLRSLLGVFVVLPSALIFEKFLFGKFPFAVPLNILLKAGALLATFLAVGYLFLGKDAGAAGSADSKGAS